MSFRIVPTDHFKRETKRLFKKHKSLKSDLELLGKQLSKNPTVGTHLGHDLYKVRLGVASKGKGKSGGARVITYVKLINEVIYLIAIFDKGEQDNITREQVFRLLKKAGLK